MAGRQTVTVDTSSVTGKNLGAVTSTTLSVTVADNPNRVLVLCYGDSGDSTGISSATYGGISFTLGKRSDGVDGCHGNIWYCIAPPVGTANISVTFSSTTTDRAYVGAVCLHNVDQETPVNITAQKLQTNSTSITCSFTPTENNCVAVDSMYSNSTTSGSALTGQVEIYKRTAGRSGGCSYETDIDATSESMGWSGLSTTSTDSSMAVVVFQGIFVIPTVTDTTTVSESVKLMLQSYVVVSDSITIGETNKMQLVSFVSVSDSTTASEYTDQNVRAGNDRNISIWQEHVDVTDTPEFPGPRDGFILDNITVTEKVTVRVKNSTDSSFKPRVSVDY